MMDYFDIGIEISNLKETLRLCKKEMKILYEGKRQKEEEIEKNKKWHINILFHIFSLISYDCNERNNFECDMVKHKFNNSSIDSKEENKKCNITNCPKMKEIM